MFSAVVQLYFSWGCLSPRDTDAADGFLLDSRCHEDDVLCMGGHISSFLQAPGTQGAQQHLPSERSDMWRGTNIVRPLNLDDRCLQKVLVNDWLP